MNLLINEKTKNLFTYVQQINHMNMLFLFHKVKTKKETNIIFGIWRVVVEVLSKDIRRWHVLNNVDCILYLWRMFVDRKHNDDEV